MSCIVYFFCLTILWLKLCIANNNDALLTVPEIIVKYGYPVEEHSVTTDDGYILTLHRIPYGKHRSNNSNKRPVVFLQHGILASSDAWVLIGPNKALGYLLADQGYDVWMGNSRGNTYSNKHNRTLTKKEYWNFSFHELGHYDLPASIDYILNLSQQSKLTYVGHSQGCVIFFVLCSEKPEYNNKINAFFGLAPGVFLSHVQSPLFKLAAFIEKKYGLSRLEAITGSFEFLPHNKLVAATATVGCSDKSILQVGCMLGYNIVGGYNPKETNSSFLPVLFSHFPAGCSSKQFINCVQEINSGKFRRYDYGNIINKQKYGMESPPEYNIKRALSPVHLYYGDKDWLLQPKDAILLAEAVVNLKSLVKINHEWAHNDFTYGVDVKKYVYDVLIPVINSYNNIS